jgi:hypothetical protein
MKNILAIACLLIITVGSYRVGKTVSDTYWRMELERQRSAEVLSRQHTPVSTIGKVRCTVPSMTWGCGNTPENWVIATSTGTAGMDFHCGMP